MLVGGGERGDAGGLGLVEDLAHRLLDPANAGGLINIAIELDGYDARRARERMAGIEQTMGQILDEAEAAGITPLAAANQHARRRLAAAARVAR